MKKQGLSASALRLLGFWVISAMEVWNTHRKTIKTALALLRRMI